ncbi:MAG: hypothetical protein J6A27_07440 [Bacteroidales bacterium]|nr:hypothetical protein [Bacteroidales bacterium]
MLRNSNHLGYIAFCLALIAFTVIIPVNAKYIISILIILENIYLLYINRKNVYLFILHAFILWSNYSILITNVLFPISDFYTIYKDTSESDIAVYTIFIFTTFLLMFSCKRYYPQYEFFNLYQKRICPLITWASLPVLALICIYGISRGEIGQRADPSPIYEYAFIIFLLSYFYSNSKIQRRFLNVLLFLFVIQNLIFGGRIAAVQLILVYILVYVKTDTRVIKYLPYAFGGIVLMTIIGSVRGAIISSSGIIESSISSLSERKLALDTAYAAFHTSVTFIYTKAQITISTQMYLLGQYVKSLVLGGGVPDAILPEYTYKYYIHTYGGILPCYVYFYLGYIGPVVIALYITKFIKKAFTFGNSNYWFLLGVYIIASVPRWYLYSPTPLFRGVLFYSILYFICDLVYRTKVKRINIQ